MLVALLPTAAAALAFLRSAEGNALDKADLRLAAALAPAVADVEQASARAAARATRLALRGDVQRALARRDRRRLERIAHSAPGVSFDLGGTTVPARPRRAPALRRAVRVLRGERLLGRVVVTAMLSGRKLAAAAGLAPDDLLIVSAASNRFRTPRTEGRDVRVGDERQRALSSGPIAGVRLVGLESRSSLDGNLASRRRKVVLAALVTLLTVAFAAYAVPPALARDRLARKGLALIGDALAATHNPRALLPVILDAGVEATGAAGGVLLERGEEVAHVGADDLHGEPLRLTLSDEDADRIELHLYPHAAGFRPDAVEIGEWLAAQAGIALENARLHRVARQQAVTDPLTQLANRRRFMEALSAELHRTERFGGPLALVLADLDDFKRINDHSGHHTGDEVLLASARVFAQTLREVDLPARIGGEEFAILLPETDLSGGERLAERLRSAVERIRVVDPAGAGVAVTASFGVAEHRSGWSEADLLRAADAALYSAKVAGKNRVAADARDPV